MPLFAGLYPEALADSMMYILSHTIVSIQVLFLCKGVTPREYVGYGLTFVMAHSTFVTASFLQDVLFRERERERDRERQRERDRERA